MTVMKYVVEKFYFLNVLINKVLIILHIVKSEIKFTFLDVMATTAITINCLL